MQAHKMKKILCRGLGDYIIFVLGLGSYPREPSQGYMQRQVFWLVSIVSSLPGNDVVAIRERNNKNQWHNFYETILIMRKLTAAGLFRTLTWFPFNLQLENLTFRIVAAKLAIFSHSTKNKCRGANQKWRHGLMHCSCYAINLPLGGVFARR